MVNCCMIGCSTKSGRDRVSFFPVPSVIKNQCEKTKELSTSRRLLWLKKINRKDLTNENVTLNTRVCGRHFISGKPSRLFENTNPDWAPSLSLGYLIKGQANQECSKSRYIRLENRKRKASEYSERKVVKRKKIGEEKNEANIETMEQNEDVTNAEYDIKENETSLQHINEMKVINNKIGNDRLLLENNERLTIVFKKTDSSSITNLTGQDIIEMQAELQRIKARNFILENEMAEQISKMLEVQEQLHKVENKNLTLLEKIKILESNELALQEQVKEYLNEKEKMKEEINQTRTDNVACREEIRKLKECISNLALNEAALKNDNKKVKFYTGLPTFTLLMHVFNLIESEIPSNSLMCSLHKFEEFLVVMLRLRLNLLEKDLAYRFGISQSTVSRILSKWIPIMAKRLECLIVWPEREVLRKTMPSCFKRTLGDKVSVILDCFEVFTDRPSSLLSKSETWSQYKHHQTIKILIGITPQGTVSFISNAWGGRASDKHITENCGILNNLLPGDVVLADRGFTIADSVGFMSATLQIPAFTNGKLQLSYDDVESTRRLANVRIHVERVIGLIRGKYRILKGTLTVESLAVKKGSSEAFIDEIITICCALCNLCPSIILDEVDDNS